MPLSPGTRIGPYEVIAPLGAGGMGEVYRASDPALKRVVAIKVLPDALAVDADRLARSRREAEILASLNHPNIAAIHGIEDVDIGNGRLPALVLELVEGPTLAERIAEGPLPVAEALGIARQIADALDAAHEHGIVHRDLKPANVKLRPDGVVKVLDFGLAKAVDNGSGTAPGLSMSPTITSPAMVTGAGVILGTAAYMAPEQAKGRAADKRSDVWAFGCVLYEMLTGRRAFEGDDVTDVLVSVLSKEPDWSALPPGTPPSVRRLLRRSLERDRRKRLPDIAVARLEIDETASSSSEGLPIGVAAATPPVPTSRLRAILPLAVTFLVAAVLAGGAAWTMRPVTERRIARFVVPLAPNQQFTSPGRHLVAVSPDGSRIAYVASGQIHLRALDELAATPVRGTEGTPATAGRSPFFSPDGQWLGFWHDGQLKKVAVSGGSPIALAAVAPPPFGASWGPGDTIVYGMGAQGIWRVRGSGGASEPIVKLVDGQQAHGPQLIAGGRAVLFTLRQVASFANDWDGSQIVVDRLDDGRRDVLVDGGSDGRALPTGHLVYALEGSILAAPLDVGALRLAGGPVAIVDDVASGGNATGASHFSVSDDGTLVYVPSSALGAGGDERTLVWVDREGREEPTGAPPRAYAYPRLSPDGTRVALDVRDEMNDIWIWDFARRALSRLTFDPEINRSPVWTPDGRRVVFSTAENVFENLFWQPADGSGMPEALTSASDRRFFATSFSPDGTRLVFDQPAPPRDLGNLVLGGGQHEIQMLLNRPHEEQNGEVSPDGRWLAYESNESGRKEIYVRPFPDVSAGRWQVSTGGGTRPLWARSGRELFYMAAESGAIVIMAAPVTPGDTFSAGVPKAIVRGAYLSPQAGRTYDVSPDGRRFLVIKAAGGSQGARGEQSLILVQHWFEELTRRVPSP